MKVQEAKLEADSVDNHLVSLRRSNIGENEEPDCGYFGIRIDRNGTWYYRGSPIDRKAMVKLFATVLNRHEDGSYWLTTPVENGWIEVDEVPYVAVEVMCNGSGRKKEIDFRTNLDVIVPLDQEHLLRMERQPGGYESRPYIHVGKGLDARITRAVFYHLVDLGEKKAGDEGTLFGVWSRGEFFSLGAFEE